MIWGICASCGRSCEAGAYCARCRAAKRRDGWRECAALLGGMALGFGCVWLLMGGPAS